MKKRTLFYFKSTLNFLCLSILIGCNQIENKETSEVISVDSSVYSNNVPGIDNSSATKGYDMNHKYSYVKMLEDGSYVSGLLELYGVNDYTQAVTLNGFTQSGRGSFSVNGNVLTLNKTSGIAIDGDLKISKGNDGNIWLTLSNGITYVQDDESQYIKNMEATPGSTRKEDSTSLSKEDEEKNNIDTGYLTYEGLLTDEQSGLSQNYTLSIASDFSYASIGGGPYTKLQDQGEGLYMWIDGSIIGMSFKVYSDRCVVYGSEGDYFCTLYKR